MCLYECDFLIFFAKHLVRDLSFTVNTEYHCSLIFKQVQTQKLWQHNNNSDGRINGFSSYLEQAESFLFITALFPYHLLFLRYPKS